MMSKMAELKILIQTPSFEQLTAFREWFTKSDADAWDRELEAGVMSGKLDALAEHALRDHHAGRSTKL